MPSKRDAIEIEAGMFFFKWSATSLSTYTKTIRTNYLYKLVQHCTHDSRVGESPKEAEDDSSDSSVFDYNDLGSDPRVIRDDREEIKHRLSSWKKKSASADNCNLKTNKTVALAELSCLYRLKTLLKMCASLSEIMTKMGSWMDKNKALMKKYAAALQIFPYCRKIFESVCAIGEVFRLKSIDWKEEEHSKFLRPADDDYESEKNKSLEIRKPEEYCPFLMNKINYFRSLVYVLGCSFTALLETIFVKISVERCEIRSRQINVILKSLPPQYLFCENNLKLSGRATRLLDSPPKNDHSFPMVSTKWLEKSVMRKSLRSSMRSTIKDASNMDPSREKVETKREEVSEAQKSDLEKV